MAQRILLAANAESGIITDVDPQLEQAWQIPGGLVGLNVKTLLEAAGDPRQTLLRQIVSEFIYTAAHDLKSPLRHMGLMTGMLRDELGSNPPGEASELMAQIEHASRKASHLVQRLQGYAEIITHPPTFESDVDLTEVIESAVSASKIRDVGTVGIDTPSDGSLVFCDRRRIHTLLDHLLGNALQFRGTDDLHVKVNAARVNGSWHIAVADNGRGVDHRDVDRLFRPFRRMHPEYVSGSGLGLAICQAIVLQHQGRIWLDRDHQPGAKFCVCLPVL